LGSGKDKYPSSNQGSDVWDPFTWIDWRIFVIIAVAAAILVTVAFAALPPACNDTTGHWYWTGSVWTQDCR